VIQISRRESSAAKSARSNYGFVEKESPMFQRCFYFFFLELVLA
jgi:hypothetical protein